MSRGKVLQKKNVNNKGMTLVEVLVAMMILTIVSMVLLQGFVSATRYNKKAREKQRCLHVAQSVMEGFKAYDLESIASQFNHQSPFRIYNDLTHPITYSEADRTSFSGGKFVRNTTVGSEDKYHFVMKDVFYDGNEYDVDITLEPDTSSNVGGNTIEVPDVPEFNKYNDGFCTMKTPEVEKNYVYEDCLDFMLNGATFFPKLKAGTTALTDDQKSCIKFEKRTITININEVDGSTIVDVKSTYDYELDNIEYTVAGIGGASDSPAIADYDAAMVPDSVIDCSATRIPEYEAYNNRNTRPFAALNNIYIYYTPDYDVTEEIKVINNTGGTYTVYLIKQRVGTYGNADWVNKDYNYNPTIVSATGVTIKTNAAVNLYNNTDLVRTFGSGVEKKLYETTEKILEYKVKVYVKNANTGDFFELDGSMFDK